MIFVVVFVVVYLFSDDDMMSIASMMSVSNLSTIGYLEDDEDDDYNYMYIPTHIHTLPLPFLGMWSERGHSLLHSIDSVEHYACIIGGMKYIHVTKPHVQWKLVRL